MKAGGKGDTAAAGGYWLEKNNSEYDQVHYYLRACVMDQGEINKLEIWKIENLDMTFRYDRKTSNMLKLASWTSTKSLPGDNTVESICNHGFSFDKTLNNGAEFNNGVIDFSSSRSDDISTNKDYSFIYSEIAVGRSFVYDNDLKRRQTQPIIPVGYDSLYLPENPLDRDANGEFSLQEYHLAANFDNREARNYSHRYFIQDPLQIQPKYIVRFKLNTSPTHSINSNNMPDDGEDYVYYDTTSFNPLTKAQRNNINYAAGNSNIQSIEVSFNSTVESHHQADPMVENKKMWLDRQLESVEDKVREVNLNYAEISEAIAETAAKAIANLQALTKTKLQTCLSIEIELRRQQEQLQWLDIAINNQLSATSTIPNNSKNGHVNFNVQNRKKLDFLKSYKYHSMFRNTLSRSKPNEIMLLNTIHADIKIAPDIKIYLDPFYSHSHPSESNNDVQDGGRVSSSNHQSKDNFATYTNEFHQNQHFSVPPRTEYPLVAGSIQNLINSEIDSISTVLQAAMAAPGIPLPDSLLKPLISGERYEPPLHDILRGFENDFADTHVVNERAKETFHSTMKNSMGAPPQFNIVGSPTHHHNVPYYAVDSPIHDDLHSTGASTLGNSAAMSHHSQASPRSGNHYTGPVQQHEPAYRSTPHKNGRGSVLMLPPTSGGSVVSDHSKQAPLQSPTAAAARSASPVANDRLFHSATQDGQVMKSLTAHEDVHHKEHQHAEEADLEVHMSVNALVKVISNNYTQYSLSDISNRKKKQLLSKSITTFGDAVDALVGGSKILGRDKVLAERVYFNLPFFAKPPQVKLLYSTDYHNRSMEELFQKTLKHRGSSIILIRSGEFIFGAYLSHPLTPTCQWAGSPACYLFSLTLDIKLPYHARVANQSEFAHVTTPLAYYIQSDSIFIGNGDLSFDVDLTNGSSELENCYGVGLEARSNECLCLLAGSPLFTIDELEVWGVTMN